MLLYISTLFLMLQSFETLAKSTDKESFTENVFSNSESLDKTLANKAPLTAGPCNPKHWTNCKLPNCYCGDGIPGDLLPEETPQFVLLTFDDAINPQIKTFLDKIFGRKGRKRLNPDGCSIKATFYVSHDNTMYSLVQDLYSDGHEIASHTITHGRGNVRKEYNEERWRAEIVGQKQMLERYAGIHPKDIQGVRFPLLEVDGDEGFRALHQHNFLYDSSIPTEKPLWPYTLDYQMPGQCQIPPCPKMSYPGLWEIPLSIMKGIGNTNCNMWDQCRRPDSMTHETKTKYYIRNMFMQNFDEYYTGKDANGKTTDYHRTPFPLFWHAATFLAEDVRDHHYNSLEDGFLMFLDTILDRDDVFFVTSRQLIHWMKNPKPLSEMRKKKSRNECRAPFIGKARHCSGTISEFKCHAFDHQEWRTCQANTCPPSYPSLYNIDGMNSTLKLNANF